jgi:transposase
VITLPSGTQVWLAAGVTDMRRGMHGLAVTVQTVLAQNPHSGHVFVFRGRRSDLVKLIWWSGDGLCLFAKKLERRKFVWPQATSGTVYLSAAQLSMLLEGINWKRIERTWPINGWAHQSPTPVNARAKRKLPSNAGKPCPLMCVATTNKKTVDEWFKAM